MEEVEEVEEDDDEEMGLLLQVRDRTPMLRVSLLPNRVEYWSPTWVAA